MVSRLDRSKLIMTPVATALSAVCWWFGAQLHPIWWLAWLAPLPILWLATRVRASWAAAAAFVAFASGALGQWHYLHVLVGLPAPKLVLAFAGPALIFVLTTLLYRRLATRGLHLAAALSVPALWTAFGYIFAVLSPDGTWGNLAYTQLDALAVIQIAAVTGLWGVGFLVMLAPAGAAVLSNGNAPRRARLRTALVGGAIVAIALGFGAWHLTTAGAGAPMRIGLVSLNGPIHPTLASPKGQRLVQRYVTAVERLAAQGAQMVVMPEVTLTAAEPNVPPLTALAQRLGITLVTSVDYRPAGRPERNMSLAFHPAGGAPATYSKHHLVPGLERRFTPGDTYTMLDGTPRVGLLICKDLDFPATSRAYAARGAQLMLVPAWDFDADDWLHSRMAIMRGVESGFAIARAARDGRLTLSDDRGRVLAEANSVEQDARIIGTLPLRHTHTLYARWGDWFAWLDLAGLLVLLVLAFYPRKTLNESEVRLPA